MEAQQQARQNHRDQIDSFIDEAQRERPQDHGDKVRNSGDHQGERGAAFGWAPGRRLGRHKWRRLSEGQSRAEAKRSRLISPKQWPERCFPGRSALECPGATQFNSARF